MNFEHIPVFCKAVFTLFFMMYYSSVVPAATAFILVTYFIIKPLADYFRDPKGLRKYPSINPVAGITNLGFMYEAAKGHRSDKLSKLHQKHPVVRIGPNSLSFSGCQAIRVGDYQ